MLDVFPELQGRSWNYTKTPRWSNLIQESGSGFETRAGFWSYPRWVFGMGFEFLRDDGTTLGDLQKIMGLFLKCKGNLTSFLFKDPDDNLLTDQVIGIGNGEKKDFQIIRTFADFNEPVRGTFGTVTVKFDEDPDPVTGFTVNDSALITFTDAPALGVEIKVSCTYLFRVRFVDQSMEFSSFAAKLWEAKKCELISLKGRE